jgi:hypothetical protein
MEVRTCEHAEQYATPLQYSYIPPRPYFSSEEFHHRSPLFEITQKKEVASDVPSYKAFTLLY